MKISAIVIARNEEARIEKCLLSLAWVDEVIVVDNGSTDATRELANKKGAIVVSAGDVRDFAGLRNIGKEKAHGEWLLYIDADEIVSEELRKEIQEHITRSSSLINGYEVRRKNYYLGAQWPKDEYLLRFMRKDALVEWYGTLHETARVNGAVGRLNGAVVHDTHRTLEEMVAKTNEWSGVEAILRLRSGHPPVVWWRFARVMLTAFIDSFVKQGGWKAGIVGLIESMYQAFSIFITYAKLWELQSNRKIN